MDMTELYDGEGCRKFVSLYQKGFNVESFVDVIEKARI
jgi:hypothetical protein